ncbi:ABC transporter permease subunit [Brenneria populi]|uniref:sn-glycerol-3-phosphate transport system permease protein UgpA n=1 Tax=Brenneria populi TaxID=1505588 RepID=A0ABU6JS66_9GAMM|nr:ABC transporter permease subunit [Brenneria populi Li et al. 2015]
MKKQSYPNRWLPLWLALPQLALVLWFIYWPASSLIDWSFTLEPPFGGGGRIFVGWDNFREIFADPEYARALRQSLLFSLTAPLLSLAAATALAICVDRGLRGAHTCSVLYILPYAVAAPAAGLAFSFIFSPEAGLLAGLNAWRPGTWDPTRDSTHAMALLVACFSWKWVGYNFLFLLAGLRAIPRYLLEAAALDGAGPFKRALDIQLPLLTPSLFFLFVLNLNESLVGPDTFGIIDMTTQGGPAKATDLLIYRLVNEAFEGLNYSGSAAQSLLLVAITVALAMLQFRVIERRVHYK